jgi:endonuclease-8
MSPSWNEEEVIKKLLKKSDAMVCDALLDQEIFAGAGNIIKNEVLYRMQLQPTTRLRALTKLELRLLVRETRLYSLQFYVWKKQYLLRKNWRIFRKKKCPVCGSEVTREPTGVRKRRSFYCSLCQKNRKTPSRSKINEKAVGARLAQAADQIIAIQNQLPLVPEQGGVEREH